MLGKKAEVKAFLSLYNDLKQALQDTLAPDIKALRAELTAMEKRTSERFDDMKDRITQVETRMDQWGNHIDKRIESLHNEMLAYRREILAHLQPLSRDDYEPER
jgi:hypothetical protein